MRLSNVNTSDIIDAIRLGCRMMSNVFNADDDDFPFFGSEVRPNPQLSGSDTTQAHVPGRLLNGLLNAEDAAGIAVDPDVIEKHSKAALSSYSGPVALPLNRSELNGPPNNLSTHDVREGFHALYSLVKYRGSEQAKSVAEASIGQIFDLFNPDSGWDLDRFANLGVKINDTTFIIGLARSIGPLVKYYRSTGYGPALELAVLLKEKATGEFFLESGVYDRDSFGPHTHSTTCVMSSLAQLADLLDDTPLLERVKAFYDNGLWEIRDDLGWVIESSRDEASPDRGEINNSGDIVETALILGRRGFTDCFEDAERIVRCHILPSQLRDNSFIVDPPNPDNVDGLRDIADRHLGGFGFPAPYGHAPIDFERISFNTDIVGGGVGSLCEVLREAVRTDESSIHRVNLHFDCESDHVKVESPYTSDSLRITTKSQGPLLVRIPSWVDSSKLTVSPTHRLTDSGYVLIPEPEVGTPVEVRFPLTEREIALNHRTRDIRVRLQGDSVLAMENHGADLTFFDPLE